MCNSYMSAIELNHGLAGLKRRLRVVLQFGLGKEVADVLPSPLPSTCLVTVAVLLKRLNGGVAQTVRGLYATLVGCIMRNLKGRARSRQPIRPTQLPKTPIGGMQVR